MREPSSGYTFVDLERDRLRTGRGASVGDVRRLRVALRLLFSGEQADELVAPLAGDDAPFLDSAALRMLSERARTQYALRRVTTRLPWVRAVPDLPLGPNTGASADAALALALRSGLALDVERLADVLDMTPDEVGHALYAAYRAAAPELPEVCGRFQSVIGRVNDRTLDPGDRLEIMAHLQDCRVCQPALEAIQTLDADLAAELRRLEATLPAAMPRARVGRFESLWPLLAAGVAGIAIIAVLIFVVDFLRPAPDPIPLVALDETPAYRGWIVQQDLQGVIQARNLATGALATVGSYETGGWGIPFLSRDASRMAIWRYGAQPNDFTTLVEFSAPGQPASRYLVWDDLRVSQYPLGWLGNHTFLVVREAPNSSPNSWSVQDEPDPLWTVIAIDPESGDERVWGNGYFSSLLASPDGTRALIYRSSEHDLPGNTIELWSVGADGLEELLARDENRALLNAVWAPDSSRVYLGRISDAELRRMDPSRGYSSMDIPFDDIELAALGRDGGLESVLPLPGRLEVTMTTVSPDGSTLIFSTLDEHPAITGSFRRSHWRLDLAGGEPVALLPEDSEVWWVNALWSPDGTTLLLTLTDDLYLDATDTSDSFEPIPATVWLALGPDWEVQRLHSSIGYGGASPTVWLPEGTFAAPAEAPAQLRGEAAAPQPVTILQSEHRLTATSSVSPDGRYVVLYDAERNVPTIWDWEARRGRRLQPGSSGGAWLPDGSGVIDSLLLGLAQQARLILYAPSGVSNASYVYDFRRFDPAGLGEDDTRRYAQPIMSPDLAHTAFFVTSVNRREVELWVTGWELPPQMVASWLIPSGQIADTPLLALWADEQTLLFAQPDGWSRGLPSRVQLSRLRVGEGAPLVEPLLTLTGRGRDVGLMLREMTLSPDGTQIAYRLRHFTAYSNESGRADTVHVMSVADLGHALELEREQPGDGLAWSRDSRFVVAGLRDRLALLGIDGRSMAWITSDADVAGHPVWIDDHELWFSLDTGSGPEVWRVRVD
jgi:hypothetical protein